MSPQGVYSAEDVMTAGDEVSSTYEGRHVTLYADNLNHAGSYVTKGLPVVWHTTEGEAVGIALATQTADTGNILIAIDTEGIWAVDVQAVTDNAVSEAVTPGDRLYINISTLVVSKISTATTQIPFGYSLGNVTSSETNVIAVKVHFDPLVAAALEVRGTPGDGNTFASVGNSTYPLTYAAASDVASEIWATFSFATTGAFYGLLSAVLYSPATSGYAHPVGVVGRVTLDDSKTFTGGQAGMEGVRGHIQFNNGATLNQASSIFAALRGVITSTGTPVFTAADTVACIYCDNQCSIDLRGVGVANGSAFASFQNHGGGIDHLIHVHGSGPSPITNIFSIQGVPGFMSSGAAAGSAAKMKMLWGTTIYYINIYQA